MKVKKRQYRSKKSRPLKRSKAKSKAKKGSKRRVKKMRGGGGKSNWCSEGVDIKHCENWEKELYYEKVIKAVITGEIIEKFFFKQTGNTTHKPFFNDYDESTSKARLIFFGNTIANNDKIAGVLFENNGGHYKPYRFVTLTIDINTGGHTIGGLYGPKQLTIGNEGTLLDNIKKASTILSPDTGTNLIDKLGEDWIKLKSAAELIPGSNVDISLSERNNKTNYFNEQSELFTQSCQKISSICHEIYDLVKDLKVKPVESPQPHPPKKRGFFGKK